MRNELHPVIGIDLGTTYSAVASYNTYDETAEILKNTEIADTTKQQTTPSVIGLDPRTRKTVVGWNAKKNIVIDPRNTIIEIKREMGEEFSAETLIKFNAQGVFQENSPLRVRFAGDWYRPQEISAFTLMKMKEIAEKEIGTEIRDAVITVPAYFKEKQRKATREAALLAGLYPRQIIPEPTAAAICYGVDRGETARKVYLVYDLGGGTFDVSIIVVENQVIEVIATEGDARLGGGDFDDAITNWAIEELAKAPHNLQIASKPHLYEVIKARAEDGKKLISTYQDTKLEFAELMREFNLSAAPILTLTRKKFEELIAPYLSTTISVVNKAIEKAKVKDSSITIDAILLVGGSSRIPCIRQQLLDYFQASESFLRSDVQPDEVVARGAAILAKRFEVSPAPFDINRKYDTSATLGSSDEDFEVHFIAEHSLGILVVGESETGQHEEKISYLIKAGAKIPSSEKRDGYQNMGPSEYLPVQVYQGDGPYIHDHTLIGVLTIGPMTPMEAGRHKFEVTFSLDRDGLLSAEVFHINENKRYEGRFESATGIRSEELGDTRKKLLNLYGSQGPSLITAPAPVYEMVAPPPPMDDVSQEVSAPPPTEEISQEVPVPPSPMDDLTAASAAAPDAPSEQLGGEQVELLVEVPERFNSLLRRIRKILIKEEVPELLAAYNNFVDALNKGVDMDELEEQGDELEDLYHDTRAKFA